MNTIEKKHLTLRVREQNGCRDWEILTSDGSPIDGWYSASVGIDHSGRHCLHVVFDQFDCISADGEPIQIELKGISHTPVNKSAPLPNPRTHKKNPMKTDVDWEWE